MDSSPTPATTGPCVRAESKGGGALGSLSSPLRHLCFPVTHYGGSQQQTGAEVWLRGATGPGPPTQAAVTTHPAPPCLLEGTAPPLGPWASPGAHSLSPPEQTVSQETSSPVRAPHGSGSFAHARGPAGLSPETAALAGSAMGLAHAGPSGDSEPWLPPAQAGCQLHPRGAAHQADRRAGCLPPPPVQAPRPPRGHVPHRGSRAGRALDTGDAPRPGMGPPDFSSQAHPT